MEGGDGEDAEAVERLLRRLRHLRQHALEREKQVRVIFRIRSKSPMTISLLRMNILFSWTMVETSFELHVHRISPHQFD